MVISMVLDLFLPVRRGETPDGTGMPSSVTGPLLA
jgi:hypothetical protein